MTLTTSSAYPGASGSSISSIGQGERGQRLVEREAVAEVEGHLERALGVARLVARTKCSRAPTSTASPSPRDPAAASPRRRRRGAPPPSAWPASGSADPTCPAAASSCPIGPRSPPPAGMPSASRSPPPGGLASGAGPSGGPGSSGGSHSSSAEPSSGSTTLARRREPSTWTARSTRASRRASSSWLSSSEGVQGLLLALPLVEDVEDHRVVDPHLRGQRLRRRPRRAASYVASVYESVPSGGFLRTTLRRFLGSSPALARAFSLSTTCSGACTTT